MTSPYYFWRKAAAVAALSLPLVLAAGSTSAAYTLRVPLGGTGGPALLTGVPTPTPASLVFPATSVGSPATPIEVSLANPGPGNTVLTGAPTLSGIDAASFYVAQSTCDSVTLLPGNLCTFTVGFTPAAVGSLVATLTLESAAGAITLPVSGTGDTLFRAAAASVGGNHSVALKADGSVWTSGHNGYGQLGLGDNTNRSSYYYSGLSGVVQVATGHTHTLALKSDGTLWGAGQNSSSPRTLGINASNQYSFAKVPAMASVTHIAGGVLFSMARKSDGTVWGTGYNNAGQLGRGTLANADGFTQVLDGAAAVVAGPDYSVVLKTDGTVWGAGANAYGGLGVGNTGNRPTFTQALGLSDVVAVAPGTSHVMALKSDGTLWGSGQNTYGQLGDNSLTNRSTFGQVLTGVVAVAAGDGHTLALKSDGTLWATGRDQLGQLGSTATADRRTFIQVLSGVARVSAYGSRSIAIKTDGTVWATGYNWAGPLGLGHTNDVYVWTQVP